VGNLFSPSMGGFYRRPWGRRSDTLTPVSREGQGAFKPTDPLDIDVLLSDEERSVRDTVRDWVKSRILPEIGEWFERGELPSRELAKELGDMGLLGMHLSGYGTAGASAVMYGLATHELEYGDSGVRSLVSVQGSLAMFPIWKFGSEEQKEEWLPPMARGEAIGCFGLTEPDVGSDPASMRTSARRDGSDWILNGTKMWITNGGVSDVAVVWARTDDGIRGFVVPTDSKGFTVNDIERKISLRASVTSELVLDDVRLPEDAGLPEVQGMKGPLSCLNEARYGIVWGSMGAARACFDTALDYSRSRQQFGKPIGAFQLTQRKLVDMAVELHKGLLLALHLGRMKDEGRARPEHISFGKLNNVREALEICREARNILGANGITLEYPIVRHMNNLESVYTYEGTNEIHTLILGKALTGLDAFS
jgi:glutaryl-CoA dehydrogenase